MPPLYRHINFNINILHETKLLLRYAKISYGEYIQKESAKLILNFARIKLRIVYPDVRWNNIGPLGGQKFLDLLQSSNSNLSKLELQGNHIGKDQLMAIGKNQNKYLDA